jgi:hypothetical protein
MPMTYRTAGAWGAGKGAPLTAAEIDGNFWLLQQKAAGKEANPAQPLCIADIVPEGETGVQIHFTDGSHKSFAFPHTSFNWRGVWRPNTHYARLDTFWHPYHGLFVVLLEHTSAAGRFIAEASTEAGAFYQKMFGIAGLYDIALFFPGTPGAGLVAGAPLHQFVAPRPFFIHSRGSTELVSETPTEAAAHVLCPVYMRSAPSTTQIYPIKRGGEQIGFIEVLSGHNTGQLVVTDSAQFNFGDVLTIGQHSGTPSGQDLSVTLTCVRGEPV